jgi:hypothetical protein
VCHFVESDGKKDGDDRDGDRLNSAELEHRASIRVLQPSGSKQMLYVAHPGADNFW